MLVRDETGLYQYADLSERDFFLDTNTNSFIQPISTGTITINGEKLISGQKYFFSPEDAKTGLVLRVEQEGMISTAYHFHLRDMVFLPIPNGLYYDAARKTVCEFRDGKGREKNINDGTETIFTYSQKESNTWEFRFADGTVNFYADMQLTYQNGYVSGRIGLSGDNQAQLSYAYLNPLPMESYPAYSDAQIKKAALDAFPDFTGKTATSVQMDEKEDGMIFLDFYNGETPVETLFADRFGLIYNENMVPYYYSMPQYRKCDLNGDQELSLGDAVVMMRVVSEDAPAKAPAQAALDAADLDRDDLLTVSDAMLLIDMISRMSANHA